MAARQCGRMAAKADFRAGRSVAIKCAYRSGRKPYWTCAVMAGHAVPSDRHDGRVRMRSGMTRAMSIGNTRAPEAESEAEAEAEADCSRCRAPGWPCRS